MDWIQNGPALGDRVVEDEILGSVRKLAGNHIAPANAASGQARGQTITLLVELGKGKWFAVPNERGQVRFLSHMLAEDVREGSVQVP